MKTIIPAQKTGKAIDATSERTFLNEEEARSFFRVAKKRLQHVNEWHGVSGKLLAAFKLFSNEGAPINREPSKGDYFRIDIPGPGSKSGDGYDWVKIEAIESSESADAEMFGFRVRPAENPAKKDVKGDTAHFYSLESTSTFVVSRTGNQVTAAIYDRNIKPNTDTKETLDQVRDAIIGTAGLLGFSKIQWQQLTDGLMRD